MSHRTFRDLEGRSWEVRVRSKREWRFEPVSGNPGPSMSGTPPLYAGDDPFELSEQELRRILGEARPAPGRSGGSGAEDGTDGGGDDGGTDDGGAAKRSPFGDAWEPPEKKSPFLDDR